jgi:hypothetical protein
MPAAFSRERCGNVRLAVRGSPPTLLALADDVVE